MSKINIPLMLLSISLSVILWMVVYAQERKDLTPVRYAVKLNAEGLDTERYVVTEMDELFRFSAVGPPNKLQEMRNDTLAAYVDLTNATAGVRRYPVKIFPEEIETYVTNKDLGTIVTIEPVETKAITITVEGQGQLKDPKLRLTETVVEPAEVRVQGPKSLVDKALKGRVRLDLSSIDTSASKSFTTSVDVLDSDGKPLEQGLIRTDPLFVRVTPLLSVAPEQKMVFVVPRYTGQIADGFVSEGTSIEPKQVPLSGASLALAAVSKLYTQPIDVDGLRETKTFTVRLVVPTGLSVPQELQTVQVTINVRPSNVPQVPTTP